MPTSTLWRRSAISSSTRGVSPVRPSGDAIERISPERSFPPTFPSTTYNRNSTYRNQESIQGLGLSHAGLLPGFNPSRQPEQRYNDRHGEPHTRRRASDARGQPEHHSSSQEWSSRNSRQNKTPRSFKNKGHTRSRSTIDDLASAAIATSPTFANGSPHTYHFQGSPTTYSPSRPSTSHLTYLGYQQSAYDPPAKRVKSERLPATEWNQSARPASYEETSPTFEEVALLLGLKNELNFMKQASPPTLRAQLHESPKQPPRPFSPIQPSLPKQEESDLTITQTDTEMPSQSMPAAEESESAMNGVAPEEPGVSCPEDKMDIDSSKADTPTPQITVSTGTAEVDMSTVTDAKLRVKKRIKPTVQAEVCAECEKLQREVDEEDDTISWISCNACNRWFHASCVGFKGKSEARSVDKFVCKQCEPQHGQTTFVRKSSRARTAIDYAGLNQGLVKSSIETSMHHYIQPIKTGKFSIQTDDFARIRPELLTVEFLENMDNMKRPFVVPACWNPRFGVDIEAEAQLNDDIDTRPEQRFNSAGATVETEKESMNETTTEPVIDCDQDLLDMVMPRDLTVRKVAEIYGSQELVPVIDVKSQETKGVWTLEQWAKYYEDTKEKAIMNVISLEVSESRLGRLIRRPKVVRELDLEDQVWDEESRANQKKRPVQYYCLMSVADSYTDFHIDFGGSSVYYHILKGTKTFFFIPPEDRYLKKYEEWCNSQTQNDTWLPDLCNGCVTRVDLHEGDTAFIPAGWIHSVWTPEDSLVIGGNFLTRIDYELQLKVANVEKVTKVAPKFRYPYFQKVMWYTLIKYLEDDPVPEEVLQDFQDDPEYTYLRANPIWHEIGDLANDGEPDSTEYNARVYPKSEIKGLVPLRDYLYRTARIHADLPVPDINKKQIEAVKNSIPKGHGDPLVLIKIFAIWCAWKTGNIPVPEWVYSDAGGFPEIEKKVKKPEAIRLPGERSSSRKAAQTVPRETTGPAVVTPYKPGFNAAGVNSDPSKKGRPASHKPSGVRTACDACRKRRVRCPHKEGDMSPGPDGSTPVSRSQSPAYSTSINGYNTEQIPTIAPMPDGLAGIETDQGLIYMSTNLAQAALATADAFSNSVNAAMANGIGPGSGKKSRSKACEECRKSKRRCVHDEYGRIDAAKAAEPSKPRGSSNTKRPSRPSDENLQAKRPRLDEDGRDIAVLPYEPSIDAMIDPALFEQSIVPPDDPMQIESWNHADLGEFNDEAVHETIEVKTNDHVNHNGEMPQPTLPGAATMNSVKQEPDQESTTTTAGPSGEVISSMTDVHPDNVEVEVKPVAESGTPRTTTSPLQRHSSRQPKQVERYVPEDHRSPSKPLPKPAGSERRESSAASAQTMVNSVKSRQSSSNTSATIHQTAMLMNRAGSQDAAGRAASRESTQSEDPDEKLARELQAEEHGLRRRPSMRL